MRRWNLTGSLYTFEDDEHLTSEIRAASDLTRPPYLEDLFNEHGVVEPFDSELLASEHTIQEPRTFSRPWKDIPEKEKAWQRKMLDTLGLPLPRPDPHPVPLKAPPEPEPYSPPKRMVPPMWPIDPAPIRTRRIPRPRKPRRLHPADLTVREDVVCCKNDCARRGYNACPECRYTFCGFHVATINGEWCCPRCDSPVAVVPTSTLPQKAG